MTGGFTDQGPAALDPATGLTSILFTERMMMTSPEPSEVYRDFWSSACAALA